MSRTHPAVEVIRAILPPSGVLLTSLLVLGLRVLRVDAAHVTVLIRLQLTARDGHVDIGVLSTLSLRGRDNDAYC